MVKVTDYVGMKSGKEIDKSRLFDVFYGELKTAPMINEAPLNHECRVAKIVDLGGTNDFIIGEIVHTYVKEECLSGRSPDIQKLDPIIFSGSDSNYLKVGEIIAKAYKVGRDYTSD